MSQSLLEACPCLLACGLVVEDRLSLCSLERSGVILLLLRNKLRLGVLISFPLNSIGIEISFKTNTLILSVPSLLTHNFLKLLTSSKALVNTFLYNSLQLAIFLLKCNLAKRIISGIKRTTRSNNIGFNIIIVTTRGRIFLVLVTRLDLRHVSG